MSRWSRLPPAGEGLLKGAAATFAEAQVGLAKLAISYPGWRSRLIVAGCLAAVTVVIFLYFAGLIDRSFRGSCSSAMRSWRPGAYGDRGSARRFAKTIPLQSSRRLRPDVTSGRLLCLHQPAPKRRSAGCLRGSSPSTGQVGSWRSGRKRDFWWDSRRLASERLRSELIVQSAPDDVHVKIAEGILESGFAWAFQATLRTVRLKPREQIFASKCPILSEGIFPTAANHPSSFRAGFSCGRPRYRGEWKLAESLTEIDFRYSQTAGEINERAVHRISNSPAESK